MPEIKPYGLRSQPVGPVSPPGRKAGGAGEYIAQGIKQFGQGLEQAGETKIKADENRLKIEAAQDNLETQTLLSAHHASYAQNWAETVAKADPNDKELANNFIKKFDEDGAKLGDGLRTQEGKDFFNRNFLNLRQDFVKSATAGQAQLAAVATKQNYINSLNNSSAALMNDPSSFAVVKQLHEEAIDALTKAGTLPAEKGLELKTQGNSDLAKSAVRGWIKTSPTDAKAFLDSGAFDTYLGGDGKKQMYGEITVEENSREVKQKQRESNQEKAIKVAHAETYDNFVAQAAKGQLTVDTVLGSNLPGEKKEHFIRAIEKSIVAPNMFKTDPGKFHDLYERIAMTPSDDPTAIVDEEQLDREFRSGGLSFQDLGKLRSELNRGKSDEGKREQAQKNTAYAMMKETIYRGAGPKDPQAPELYMRAQQAYDAAVEDGIKKGKTITEMTDPDFVKKVMKPFVRTPKEKLADTAKQYQNYKAKTQGKTPQQKASKLDDMLKKAGLGG